MNILAFETSCEIGSIALWHNGEILSCGLTDTPHSATALPAVHQLLAQAQLSFATLDALAFGSGPGAFTGVRLACSLAQGLACAHDLPIAPIPSLLALAYVQNTNNLYCIQDARMNEVYVAAYQRSTSQDVPVEVLTPVCVAPNQLPMPPSGQWFGCGNAFPVYASQIAAVAQNWQDIDFVTPAQPSVPTASAVASLAALMRTFVAAADAAPLYVRDKVAQTIAERVAQGGRA